MTYCNPKRCGGTDCHLCRKDGVTALSRKHKRYDGPTVPCVGCQEKGRNVRLKTPFDRVVVVNLERRPDRLGDFYAGLPKVWPFLQPERFDAVDGRTVKAPKNWRSGSGALGCRESHCSLLEAAIRDRVMAILVFEDDAEFAPGFENLWARFWRDVPRDWEMLMLGGQHILPPMPVKPGVVRCTNTQRTHAYAVRGPMVQKLLDVWRNADRHIDHEFGPLMSGYRVYAPEPFVVGQREDRSDITNSHTAPKFWNTKKGREVVRLLVGSREWVDRLRDSGEYHTGYNRDSRTGFDYGLNAVANGTKKLVDWVHELLNECEGGRKLGVWHPQVTVEDLRRAHGGPVVVVRETTTVATPAIQQPRVVWHVAAMNHWQDVATEQLALMRRVGLSRATATFVGDGLEWLEAEARRLEIELRVTAHDPNLLHYETLAMLEVQRLAKESDEPVLYFHTKGVSDAEKSKEKWRRAMERLVVEKWRENLMLLQDHDAVGFNWNGGSDPHFSGNFWLATASWVRGLPDFASFHASRDMTRMSCEFWIGSRLGIRAKSLGPSDRAWWDVDYGSYTAP